LAPYRVLDTSNRRDAGIVYFVAAGLASVIVLAAGVSLMWLTAVLPLTLLGLYQVVAGGEMKVTDVEAITLGSDAAPFNVGHASATLGFTGLVARPIWQVLAFESGPAPGHQALVTVDAMTGEVTGTYAEAVEPPA
jgi:hypothetical protein